MTEIPAKLRDIRSRYGQATRLTPQLPLWNLYSIYSLGISNHVKIRFLLKSCSKRSKQFNEELFLNLNIKQKALLSRIRNYSDSIRVIKGRY